MATIRVLIVDDSAFMRHSLNRLLSEAPSLEVVGLAANGAEGLRLAAELKPDVISLDVEMPVLDGLGMLQRLMLETPTRVVMLSSLTTEGAAVTLDALECGAIDFVPKPSGSLSIDIGRVGAELVAKIEAAAGMSSASFLRHRQLAAATILNRRRRAGAAGPGAPAKADVAVLPAPSPAAPRVQPRVAARRLVVVASSTGGPGALHTLVRTLPPQLGAAVVFVQHMPPGFTASLAGRLDAAGPLHCAEGRPDDLLVEDEILVAPGDLHLICSSSGHVQLVHLPAVNGVRPAADVTLKAVAPIYRERLLCVVLTGMGADGREGARAVKQHGGRVLAQDEATATIYGMPAAVAAAGLADGILPLPEVGPAIASWCANQASGAHQGAQVSRAAAWSTADGDRQRAAAAS